ncbi:keratin-like protein KRT222 [Pygocentrus nattereri]|uniref:Keratin 222 n=1 Tax=Pygocentrus nattereri TaxID=42514 RepID=A0AAR2IPU1_PYGNA|nr:keratin-like protein KRT222 [Pygocentrus nattereri]XP_037390614.1 keratin-like protein KRT222 [Pygocentrus nattereri]
MEEQEEPQEALRGLNDRLRGFLQHVAQLQRDNQMLQERIVEFGRRSGQHEQEWSARERTVGQLREQISQLLIENAELGLRTENTKSSVSCLQSRCEAEEKLRLRLERRVSELTEKKTDMDLANSLLERQLNSLREELLLMEEEQERELFLQQQQAADGVLAQAAAEEEDGRGMELRHPRPGPSPAPGLRPTPARTRTDTAIPNGDAPPQVSRGDEVLREARAELTEVRKRWHSLQVEIESLHALERSLQSSLRHTQQHYSQQLQDLSCSVRGLEAELEDVRDGLAAQRQQHGQLLNTKMRLEREIATYRRLLEHEEGRYLSVDGQPRRLKPWRGSTPLLQQNGVCNGSVEDGVLSEKPVKLGATLHRQGSVVILTEPIGSRGGEICTVKTQEILDGNVVRESAEGHGRVETEKIDKVIKQWEGSIFKGNPKLRKKSVSLRFDLHMAVADEGCSQTKQDSLPDVEVRLVMKRSRSIPTITQ